jgi:hypothetical protein
MYTIATISDRFSHFATQLRHFKWLSFKRLLVLSQSVNHFLVKCATVKSFFAQKEIYKSFLCKSFRDFFAAAAATELKKPSFLC